MKIDLPPYEERDSAGVQIVIHKWDTWSMDHTLSLIIHPMLIQLKETKHGAPFVDNEDVPEEWRMSEEELDKFNDDGTSDDKFFKRWDWILDEMIWTFEQKCKDKWEDDYYGPYIDNPEGGLGYFEWIDRDGLKTHQDRMNNGFRLFGKYFENLWD